MPKRFCRESGRRPVSRTNDLRAGQPGGDHEPRSRSHGSLLRHHCLRLEDGGRNSVCVPNLATDQVASGPAAITRRAFTHGYCGPGRGQSQRYPDGESGSGSGLGMVIRQPELRLGLHLTPPLRQAQGRLLRPKEGLEDGAPSVVNREVCLRHLPPSPNRERAKKSGHLPKH